MSSASPVRMIVGSRRAAVATTRASTIALARRVVARRRPASRATASVIGASSSTALMTRFTRASRGPPLVVSAITTAGITARMRSLAARCRKRRARSLPAARAMMAPLSRSNRAIHSGPGDGIHLTRDSLGDWAELLIHLSEQMLQPLRLKVLPHRFIDKGRYAPWPRDRAQLGRDLGVQRDRYLRVLHDVIIPQVGLSNEDHRRHSTGARSMDPAREGVSVLNTRTRRRALCLCLPAWPSSKAGTIVRRQPVDRRPFGYDARRVKLRVRHIVVTLDVVV